MSWRTEVQKLKRK